MELVDDLGAKVHKNSINEYMDIFCNSKSVSFFDLKPVSLIV